MFRGRFEYFKKLFHTSLKIIELRIYPTTENHEQMMDSHVLQAEDTAWCQEFACKELFRERLQLG
jgi:hypothetical protein